MDNLNSEISPLMVWRVENTAGDGPYWNLGSFIWAVGPHNPSTGRPGPYEDEILVHELKRLGFTHRRPLPPDYTFGFETREDALKWFDPRELEKLAEYGYHLVEVPARRVIRGATQVIFWRAKWTHTP
ncbi:MAG TPA: hypothetical protein PLY16_02310 [Candidatus Saccharibacteria bacterium]|nr:hypothetical protein [Candidatus Saccharibacteria bacterium]